jgi:hypothetical protein
LIAPYYPAAAFMNQSLKGVDGKAMVSFQYVYYLRVPFEVGSPGESWLVYADKILDAE